MQEISHVNTTHEGQNVLRYEPSRGFLGYLSGRKLFQHFFLISSPFKGRWCGVLQKGVHLVS